MQAARARTTVPERFLRVVPASRATRTPDNATLKLIDPKSPKFLKNAPRFIFATPATTRFRQTCHQIRLVDILRSNDEPPEQSSLRAVTFSSPTELARYDAEIGRLQGLLEKVQTARTALQLYYDGRRSVFSALYRLPADILCATYIRPVPPDGDLETGEESADEKILGRVAQVHILRIAGVCARWHTLVMGTSALWSEVTLHDVLWHRDQSSPLAQRTLGLLKSVLERGENSPLTVHAQRIGAEPMKLLAQYSRQWRTVSLRLGLPGLRRLSAVKGRLPLLETLTIDGRNASGKGVHIFSDAPRLARLTYSGRTRPTFRSISRRRCPHPRALDGDDLDLTGRVLAKIFDNLTLHVQTLSILSISKIHLLQWPHPQSLAFFARSSATQRLTILEIPYVVITEEVFVQCLDELPALEQLAASDHFRKRGGRHHLITNSLLRRLTWTADATCLVPRLHSLTCLTFLDFNDSVFLDFVRSRLEPGRRPNGGAFKVALTSRAQGCARILLPVVAGQLRKLQAQNDVAFSLDSDEE
ncbi:hypothetical protein C8J57DRAFT_1592423 [Mycena rebaudengoi]|nr:hypothetical protein C8J57DRAFT_1592423 [Mycena rebaudengoi]